MTELTYPSGLSPNVGVVSLQSILDCIAPREVLRFRHLRVAGLAFYSGEVQPGNLFFAIHGTRHNGSVYANEALRRGAVAVVAEEPLNLPCPVLVVKNARQALADAARLYYGDPSKDIDVVGITGTNGKTTVAPDPQLPRTRRRVRGDHRHERLRLRWTRRAEPEHDAGPDARQRLHSRDG